MHSYKSNYKSQKIVFQNHSRWAGFISFGSCLLPEYREMLYLIPFMCINGENDGIYRPLRSAESYYHHIHRSSNRSEALLNSPVMFLDGVNHAGILNSDFIEGSMMRSDLASFISKLKIHDIIATLVAAFINRKTSDNAANMIIQNAIDSEVKLKPMVELLEMEANVRLKRSCDSDHPSLHCPFYPMYPMVNASSFKF